MAWIKNLPTIRHKITSFVRQCTFFMVFIANFMSEKDVWGEYWQSKT